MRLRLKPLREQTIVITGASSGIGLVTARMAARQGARVVVAARSEPELRQLSEEIQRQGGQALAVPTDVSVRADLQNLASAAVTRFGGFDTWVNNAGTSIFGRLEEVDVDEERRLFDINFWGIVYGSLAALPQLKGRGGALINLGSVASDRAFPLQGMYSATKHAVRGFTDALRMELEKENAPVSVTLIKPTSIGTPFPDHARNYLSSEPTLPPPVYAPEYVARAILRAAEHPERDIYVGGAAKVLATGAAIAPRGVDRFMEATGFRAQETGKPPRSDRHRSLESPSRDLRERGEYPSIRETSVYTEAQLHPLLSAAVVASAGLALGSLWSRLKK